ncbi:hypothetical protein L1987_01687 [Smallanthus sonchifolius]|uniref:Uncharacterized protein n=1 Tax=Smallanthus sonchifolius TaxID=185202 RepID=A0ACB9K5T8_9ASTR|nr:hypothetical protein L1987_01687 [Smallanthus sonchifolius]
MMIEYELQEKKILMESNPKFGKTPQTSKPSMEENSQSDFTASMIVEYDHQEKEILKERQQEADRLKERSQLEFSASMITLMGTQSVENDSKVITESKFVNTIDKEKPQGALQSQEPKEDGKKERPSRYKRIAEVLYSPYLERVVSMEEKEQFWRITYQIIYLIRDKVFKISGNYEMLRSKDSVARLFCTLIMLDVDDVDLGEDDKEE